MVNPLVPTGQRFSHTYLHRGEPTADGARSRGRISARIKQFSDPLLDEIAERIEMELGIAVPRLGRGYGWDVFLRQAELRDVLDLVTVGFNVVAGHYGDTPARAWLADISRIFREENLRYRVDARGGVHFSIDDEFEQNNVSVIKALSDARYAAARQNFESALTSLSLVPPSTKDAVRNVFAANEGLFRLIFPAAPRLTAAEIERQLRPLLQRLTAGDAAASGAAAKLSESFKHWVDATHFYRHEAGVEEPAPPSLETAVLFVSQGAAWLRWLAEVDIERQSHSAKGT